jgi:hypothetical protein
MGPDRKKPVKLSKQPQTGGHDVIRVRSHWLANRMAVAWAAPPVLTEQFGLTCHGCDPGQSLVVHFYG